MENLVKKPVNTANTNPVIQKLNQNTIPAKPVSPVLVTTSRNNSSPLPIANVLNFLKANLSLILIFFLFCLNLFGILQLKKNITAYTAWQKQLTLENQIFKENLPNDLVLKISQIENYLPDEEKIIELVKKINKAKKYFSNFSLSFDSEEPKIAEGKYLPLSIKISGDLDKILVFCEDLLKMKYFIEITNINIGESNLIGKKTTDTDAEINLNLLLSNKFK